MTNYEKYKNLVIRTIKEGVCILAKEAYKIDDCADRTCDDCYNFITDWLNRKVDEIDWSKVPVDAPVKIKDEKGIMFRHFAKYYHGHVFVYANGQTSWTNDGETEAWEPKYVKFGRDEDAIKYAKQ